MNALTSEEAGNEQVIRRLYRQSEVQWISPSICPLTSTKPSAVTLPTIFSPSAITVPFCLDANMLPPPNSFAVRPLD